MDNIPYFITHYTPLVERKTFMQKQFDDQKIQDVKFIGEYDQESISKELVSKFDSKLSMAEISVFLKHIFILKKLVETNTPFAHVMEDDVTMIENYKDTLCEYVRQLPENADCLFTNSGWKRCQRVPEKLIAQYPGTHVFLRTNQGIGIHSPLHKIDGWGIGSGSTRTCAEYFIKLKCAQTIVHFYETQKVITAPYDLWLNRVFQSANCSVYWAHPVLGHQDTFRSSIQK